MHKTQKHKGKRIYDMKNNKCEKHHAVQHVKFMPTSQSTQQTTPPSTVFHHPLGQVTVCFGTSSCSSCRAGLPIFWQGSISQGRAYRPRQSLWYPAALRLPCKPWPALPLSGGLSAYSEGSALWYPVGRVLRRGPSKTRRTLRISTQPAG